MGTMAEFAEKHRLEVRTSSDLGWDWARDVTERHGLEISQADEEWARSASWYDVALYNNQVHRKLVLPPFGMGTAHTEQPSVSDILTMWAGIAVDVVNAGSFEDYLDEWPDCPEPVYAQRKHGTEGLAVLLGTDAFDELLYKTERD